MDNGEVGFASALSTAWCLSVRQLGKGHSEDIDDVTIDIDVPTRTLLGAETKGSLVRWLANKEI